MDIHIAANSGIDKFDLSMKEYIEQSNSDTSQQINFWANIDSTTTFSDRVLVNTTEMVKAVPAKLMSCVGLTREGKWFGTHNKYTVLELGPNTKFWLSSSKVVSNYTEAKARGIDTVPVLLGPESLLLISKPGEGVDQSFDPLSLPRELRLSIYKEIIAKLKEAGATRIQIDEPALVMELQPHQLEAFKEAYTELGPSLSSLNSILMTYHGGVSEETYRAMIQLDCFSGYGFDLVNGDKTLDFIKNIGFPPGKYLHAGIVDGRDFSGAKLKILQYLETIVGEGKLVISTSSPSIDNLDGCISEAKYLARKLLTKKHTMVDIDAASSSRMLNDRVEDETIQIRSFFFDNKIGDMNRAKMSGLTVFAPAKYEVVMLEDFADAEPASKALPQYPATTIRMSRPGTGRARNLYKADPLVPVVKLASVLLVLIVLTMRICTVSELEEFFKAAKLIVNLLSDIFGQ